MLKTSKLYIESNRIFISDFPWVIYVVLISAGVIFGILSIIVFYEKQVVIGALCAAICLFSLTVLFLNPNGEHAKAFHGRLQWGAGEDGLFLMSAEQKLSRYAWPRIKKIVIAKKVTYPEPGDNRIVNGISGLSELSAVIMLNKVNHSDVVLFYVDGINELETKIGKLVFEGVAKSAAAIAKSYMPASASEIESHLRQYAPKGLLIEYRKELKLGRAVSA